MTATLLEALTDQAATVLDLHDDEIYLLTNVAGGVESDIRQFCHRDFDPMTGTATRQFHVPIGSWLAVPDLTVDDDHPVTITAWDSAPLGVGTDVDLVQRGDKDGLVVVALERRDGDGFLIPWRAESQTTSGRNAIRILGWWGWPAIPAGVLEVGVMVICQLWQARDQDYSAQSGVAVLGTRGQAVPSLIPPAGRTRLSQWVRAPLAVVTEG